MNPKFSSPEYNAWKNMRRRCSTPSNPRFEQYGGRGIKICRAWDSFEQFLKDMGPRPSGKHTIERVNNDLGYTPENCVWATYKEQNRNYGRNHLVTIGGYTQCLTQWCEDLGVNRSTIFSRIHRGWGEMEALFA